MQCKDAPLLLRDGVKHDFVRERGAGGAAGTQPLGDVVAEIVVAAAGQKNGCECETYNYALLKCAHQVR